MKSFTLVAEPEEFEATIFPEEGKRPVQAVFSERG